MRCSFVMCVYLCVVAIEACPRNSCTTRMSAPFRKSNVATVWRSMCGVICRWMPASSRNRVSTPLIPWVESLCPRALRNNAGLSVSILSLLCK